MNLSYISLQIFFIFSGRFGVENLNVFRAGQGRNLLNRAGPGREISGPCAALIYSIYYLWNFL